MSPALPPVPRPPTFPPDSRQVRTRHVLGSLIGVVDHHGFALAGANLSSGYPAGSVDLRAVKDALEGGLSHFTTEQVRDRWDPEIRDWVHAVLRSWIQRTKIRSVSLQDAVVRVHVETQDDDGCYLYEFDVLLSRQPSNR